MAQSANVFDRALVRRHRDRAAADFAAHDFLFREVAERLCDRLSDVTRTFASALDLGCHAGTLSALVAARGGIETLVQCDLSPAMAAAADATGRSAGESGQKGPRVLTLAADEEFLPFAPASFDLVASCLSLHWVNDLPGALVQIGRCLKPDGLFLAAMLGGGTLAELRTAWIEADLAEQGGAGVHVSPFADVRDAGALLQRAGFALPVVDSETLTVRYTDAHALMDDLRGMGEANAVSTRARGFARRATLARVDGAYRALCAEDGAGDGRVPASFQVLYLTAWAPHESQPKALKPGSAAARLADALGTAEHSAGDKARPR
ncbi:MAG: methyltransferase domain-containing protein [Alphaproteobacteria bacterium]